MQPAQLAVVTADGYADYRDFTKTTQERIEVLAHLGQQTIVENMGTVGRPLVSITLAHACGLTALRPT